MSAPDMQLESPIIGVTDLQWTDFVRVMAASASTAVSESNELGAFAFKPRRLVDLGVFDDDLKRTRSTSSKRVIWAASSDINHQRAAKFLKNLSIQFRAFASSMVDYASKISSGTVKLPQDCSLSGGLAIAHRAGLAGFSGERFPATQAIFEKANGIF